jgi:phenylalanyl-tRNA synthetase beta chain
LKFSYRWISELAPGLTVEPRALQQLITMKTAECEGIEPYGAHFAKVVAARVVSVEPLPESRNRLARIDAGGGRLANVVCGAPNVRPGLITAWAPPGTVLGGKTIEVAVFKGVESEGMLASAAELGINRDHSKLIELDGVAPGERLPGLFPDWIIEIDNKSLTHRPDLWGHYGMAREVAAITGGLLRDPVQMELLPSGPASIRVEIEDFTLCPRYSALVFEDAVVGPSPLWLQARLESVGLNPINNLVDVTNYVLAELPQPMHAFDADKLAGDTIYVRRARAGERLRALNGETYELDPADLVIADASGPIAIAGVIGGADTAISETTKRVVLESANFQAASVRLTSARHKLRTEASIRFEKALDRENTLRGIARAIELFREVSPGMRAVGGVADCHRAISLPQPIVLTNDFVRRKLGKQIPQQEIVRILTALGFDASETTPGVLTVTVPSWRSTKDISLKDDLVEEIGRIVGYEEIEPAAPLVACTRPPSHPMRLYLRSVRAQLAAQGFTEVYNYSFIGEADAKRFGFDLDRHVAIQNPISADWTHMRASLLPGLFRNILSNARSYREFRIFEIGREIHARPAPELPDEVPHAAAVLYNAQGDERDFFELKRVVECLFPGAKLAAANARSYEHPMRAAEISWRNAVLGRLFELHPSLLEAEGLEGRAMFFDVDLRLAQELAAKQVVKYKPLRKYPTSGFDLSVVADMRVPVADIESELTQLAGSDLASIEFVRQYVGPPLAEGRKSVTYHLEVGALDHTLDAEEVTAIRNRIIEGLQSRGFELRM